MGKGQGANEMPFVLWPLIFTRLHSLSAIHPTAGICLELTDLVGDLRVLQSAPGNPPLTFKNPQ
jgi:hypothetical protein